MWQDLLGEDPTQWLISHRQATVTGGTQKTNAVYGLGKGEGKVQCQVSPFFANS